MNRILLQRRALVALAGGALLAAPNAFAQADWPKGQTIKLIDRDRRELAAVDRLTQQLRCSPSQFAMGQADGGERRRDYVDQRHVVVPGHADVAWDLQARLRNRVVGAQRDQVVAADHRVGPDARSRQQLRHGVAPRVLVERFVRNPILVPSSAQLFPEGVLPELQRFYYDTAQVANPAALSALTKVVPLRQIVFGSDYPYRTSIDHVKGLRSAGVFSEAEVQSIERGTPLTLLPRLRG